MRTAIIAAGLALTAGLGAAAPADAQPYGYHHGDGYRHSGYRSRHYGYRPYRYGYHRPYYGHRHGYRY